MSANGTEVTMTLGGQWDRFGWLIPAAAAPGFYYYSWFRAPDE